MSDFLPSLETLGTVAKGTVASAVGISSVGLGLLYYGQNYLIYPSAFPRGSRTHVQTPGEFGLPYEDVTLDTQDHVKVRAYFMMQQKNLDSEPKEGDEEFASTRPTVIMFHGNGGNIGHRIPLAKRFYTHMHCNVFMLSYRGYGLSEGQPSEKGIRMDAQAALDYVSARLRNTPVILFGQSIGGAVAIDLASRNPQRIRALILENTFLSLPRLIPSAIPMLTRVSFLCHQKWDSAAKVKLIPLMTPILMISGFDDEIVPKEHMAELEKLLREVPGKGRRPGRLVKFPFGRHNDTCLQYGYWQAIEEFIASC